MAANVETMMYVGRNVPWHGLGISVAEAPTSEKALEFSGLNWHVVQKSLMTRDGIVVPGFKANLRETDNQVLGVVTDRYKVVQNEEAFAFTDALLGEGVTYETAGSLQNGRKIWILAKLPEKYIIGGDEITPYLVFMNSHDGNSGIKVAMTPIRVVCNNTLNLALSTAKRTWSFYHVGDMKSKLDEARYTLLYADKYMEEFGKVIDVLNRQKLSDRQVYEYLDALFPLMDNVTEQQRKNLVRMKNDVMCRYFEAPDLKEIPSSGYRFVNAVSDFATHAKPLRESANYRENLFARTIEGNPLIDRAYNLVRAA